MKPSHWVGILLIVLGALVLAYQGHQLHASEERSRCGIGARHHGNSRANSPSSNTWRAGIGWRGRLAGHGGEEQVIGR